MRAYPWPQCLIAVMALVACQQRPATDELATQAKFDSSFVKIGELEVSMPPEPLQRVIQADLLGDDGVMIVDQIGSSVRLYSAGGRLLSTIYDHASERNTYWGPLAAIRRAGAILVGEQPGSWILRYPEAGGGPDTIRSSAGFVWSLIDTPHGLIVGERNRDSVYVFLRSALTDSVGRVLYRRSSVIPDAPYWGSVATESVAATRESAYVSFSLAYPITRIDLGEDSSSSVGMPPASWRQATRPVAGFFSADRRQRLAEWLPTFTIISGLHVLSDRCLIVEHGVMGRRTDGQFGNLFIPEPVSFDVYDGDGTKLLEDLPLAGDIVGADTALTVATFGNGRLKLSRYKPTWH